MQQFRFTTAEQDHARRLYGMIKTQTSLEIPDCDPKATVEIILTPKLIYIPTDIKVQRSGSHSNRIIVITGFTGNTNRPYTRFHQEIRSRSAIAKDRSNQTTLSVSALALVKAVLYIGHRRQKKMLGYFNLDFLDAWVSQLAILARGRQNRSLSQEWVRMLTGWQQYLMMISESSMNKWDPRTSKTQELIDDHHVEAFREHRACRVIQRAWREANSNPHYELCRRRLQWEFDHLEG